jgi:putative tricarboxylic transport membrane protein
VNHRYKLELAVYGIFCSVSGVALFFSWRLGLGGIGELGSGLLPFVANLCIFVVGVLLILVTISRRGRGGPSVLLERLDTRGWVRVASVLLSLAIWPLLVNVIGYILSNFLVSLGMAKAIGYKGWIRPMILSAGLSLFIWFIFGFMFAVDLPAGLSF